MKISSINDYSNIGLEIESIDLETSTGKEIRLFYDRETNQVSLLVDHEILKTCDQKDFLPVIRVKGFSCPE